jgi:hypothetical protein
MSEIKKDLISLLYYESQAYQRFEDIEKLIESGGDLSVVPFQPLYQSLQAIPAEQMSLILPQLSKDQRQSFLDLDQWKKDQYDPMMGQFWLNTYYNCNDDQIKFEYAQSDDFLLLLKGICQIYTFDTDDPEYPEKDNYFLTEDNLLLIEYPEDFKLVLELQHMIKNLYTEWGVDGAYSFLFKLVADSFSNLEEDSYLKRNHRLSDIGFMGYLEALEWTTPYPNLQFMDSVLKNNKVATGEIPPELKNQTPPAQALLPYLDGLEDLKAEFDDIDSKRRDFLQFNFICLVNASLIKNQNSDVQSSGFTRTGQQTKIMIELGYDYLKINPMFLSKKIMDLFDFRDLFRIGLTLIDSQNKKIKKILHQTGFDQEVSENFLGPHWTAFLDASLDQVPRFKCHGSANLEIVNNIDNYFLWKSWGDQFIELLPFIQKFYEVLEKIKEDSKIHSLFFLNYDLPSIDFEAILLSSLFNFDAGHFKDEKVSRLGVTISDVRQFFDKYFFKQGKEFLIKDINDLSMQKLLLNFKQSFGFQKIQSFEFYLYQIMIDQLNSYEIETMEEEDFKHFGGPIILGVSSTVS